MSLQKLRQRFFFISISLHKHVLQWLTTWRMLTMNQLFYNTDIILPNLCFFKPTECLQTWISMVIFRYQRASIKDYGALMT